MPSVGVLPEQSLSVVLPVQLFPGRPPVRKLLEMLQEWLASLPLDRIPYDAVLDLVTNKMRVRRPLRRGRSVWGPLAAPRHWLLSPVSTTTSRRSLGQDLRQLTEMMGVSTGR